MVKVYTRTGDDGTTSSYKGGRVPKDHPMMEAIGTVDELNSILGLLNSNMIENAIEPIADDQSLLLEVQSRLFDLGAALASVLDGQQFWQQAQHLDESDLESAIDRLDQELPEIKQFILPGGATVASLTHLGRAVCRRAERTTVTLQQSIGPAASEKQYVEGFGKLLRFLNRLSDYLFVLARRLNQASGHSEIFWQSKGK